MDVLSIVIIAIALSMDSFAVAISNGLTIRNLNKKKTLLIAFSLAVFQALMPFIGWFAGIKIEKYIEEFDHWIAFGLLLFIGAKMIFEAFANDEESKGRELRFITLIGQSIATSIDALAVGVSFAILKMEILMPIFIIGVVTFIFSILGLQLGKFFGRKFGKYVEIFGGIVLIGIGVKILVEHIM
ncbi:MAG: manganese efflux pump [Bacteroidetes bacterium]|nr:MAG: manganese efflux pump [Bacteroidota bacterium]